MATAPAGRQRDGLPFEINIHLRNVGLLLKGLGIHGWLGSLAHQIATALAYGLAALLAHERKRHRVFVGGAQNVACFVDVVAGNQRKHLSKFWRGLHVANGHGAVSAVVMVVINPDFVIGVSLGVLDARRCLDLDGSRHVVWLEKLQSRFVRAKRKVQVLHAEESVSWHIFSFQSSVTSISYAVSTSSSPSSGVTVLL